MTIARQVARGWRGQDAGQPSLECKPLHIAKVRGTKLGNPDGRAARELAAEANRAGVARQAEAVRPLAEQGLSLRDVAREPKERWVPTARGG